MNLGSAILTRVWCSQKNKFQESSSSRLSCYYQYQISPISQANASNSSTHNFDHILILQPKHLGILEPNDTVEEISLWGPVYGWFVHCSPSGHLSHLAGNKLSLEVTKQSYVIRAGKHIKNTDALSFETKF